MNDTQVREIESARRSREFTNEHPAPFPARSHGASLVIELQADIIVVEEQAALQMAAMLDRQESTEQKRIGMVSLRAQLRAISQTARSMDGQLPGTAEQFKMPRGGDQATINLGRAYLINATPIAGEFISRNLPETFLADLQATLDSIAAADNRQSQALSALTAATAAIAVTLKRIRQIIRELDTIIRNHYRDDPATLAAWRSASRVEKAPKRAKAGDPPPSAPPSTPPSA
ncbi:MAG TPA: hypothetical protein VF658_14170 [Pyrinomonadaceae bacterium]|jgi:hypothetical protein